ncbi:YrhK family protein [Actinomycetospora cinnamomea]|uniref:YrhK-like protein n=1 Tax=Actinomycetospora cinnamomea TaxID=663609 RepID=A0A2U1F403_9PSEU|nr:YrhK family protein [Actinomycetospora cinnamomea]PVZ06879.1 YrhK-like protein [Actinomycetospora cinnamomea]
MAQDTETRNAELTLHLGKDELVIRRRYEALSIVNDILIGLWFTVGSILFFFESTTTTGTWFFVIGSVELLIRPMIRMTRIIHLGRPPGGVGGGGTPRESDQDF